MTPTKREAFLRRLARFTEPGHVPIVLGIVFITFAFVYRALDFPAPSELADIGKELYAKYGLLALLASSFIEGTFVVGFYLPGSFVIILSIYLSPKSFISLAIIAVVSCVGFLLAAGLNYSLGRFGLYRLLLWLGQRRRIADMRYWLDRRGLVAVPIAAAVPNTLAVATVCMGIGKEGAAKTLGLTALGLVIWVPLWTVMATAFVSRLNIDDPHQHWYIFSGFILWGAFLIVKEWVYKSRGRARSRSSA